MTEEARDQSFGRYLAAKKAVAAHGFSENFEEEQSFATAPSSAASDVSAPAVLIYPRVSGVAHGVGKTYIVKYTGTSVKPFEIVPATLVTSRALRTLVTFGQGGSMATQQPPTTEDESVEEIIWRVGTTLSARYRAKLTSRLSELQKSVQEEELDGRGITIRSLQHFVELLKAYPSLRCPTVSVTPDRNIYTSWKSGSDRVFSIHFLPDGKVRFVIFCPNDKHSGETIRLSGAATVDVIIDIAKPHGVLKWASE
jgi:hypothetical protein